VLCQSRCEGVGVELRIGAAAGELAYVRQRFDAVPLQQRKKIAEATVGMTDGIERRDFGTPADATILRN
jgi:hypothetical protein